MGVRVPQIFWPACERAKPWAEHYTPDAARQVDKVEWEVGTSKVS
jgi:hypothetical protein